MKPVLLALTLLCASTSWAQTSSSAPSSRHEETVDDRVKELHSELKITPDEEAKWAKVADTMRSNAKTVDDLLMQRHDGALKATAVENLQSWNAIAQANAEGSKAMLDAFTSLYADMPDSQKKIADTAFRPAEGHTK
ncbi:Spy/CpxP family protein refolding chaperone [Paraburkholderia adhaesiva]|uniref:Spy/CpxP family protein refolding chaperone n=1 Tax=Paraburkholderia adhaesiva TaxID=2883244 RepID=UPI001F2A1FDE|nr:Spy/CpxP family protein refolding chaperone [Paraburkholderia adhaesiva]